MTFRHPRTHSHIFEGVYSYPHSHSQSHFFSLPFTLRQNYSSPTFLTILQYMTHASLYASKTPLSFKLLNSSGSKNLLIVTSSASPFRLLVLSTKSRASACAVAGS